MCYCKNSTSSTIGAPEEEEELVSQEQYPLRYFPKHYLLLVVWWRGIVVDLMKGKVERSFEYVSMNELKLLKVIPKEVLKSIKQ